MNKSYVEKGHWGKTWPLGI